MTQLQALEQSSLYPNTGGMGPNYLLGFRKRSIPNSADVVVIGGSQTYGNNAAIDKNWPWSMLSANIGYALIGKEPGLRKKILA